jgi:TatD DNase family protein
MSKKERPIPNFGQPIIETHCHLDYLKQGSVGDILARAREVGVERVVTISVDPGNLDRVRELAAGFDEIFATQGVHPHDARLYTPEVTARIRDGINDDKVLAVGEIGLDYHYDHSPRDSQRSAFASQLAIAADNDMPIVVHTREAEADTRAILSEFAPQIARKGVIHSFTSSLELAETCLELGFCLGFNGIITFNAADNVREVLAATPLDRILLETDAPFLTPTPFRGRENAPCYLPFIAERMATVKDLDVQALLTQVHGNALGVFWPEETG